MNQQIESTSFDTLKHARDISPMSQWVSLAEAERAVKKAKHEGILEAVRILQIQWNNLDGKGDELYDKAQQAITTAANKLIE